MNCQEITTRLNAIKIKKTELDELFMQGKFREAKALQTEISELVQKVKVETGLIFVIEGKEFPVFKLEIGGKTAEELEKELIAKNFKIYDFSEDMLHSPDFVTSPTVEQIDLVRLKVSDLGFPSGATTDEIYAKAQELGLELCPAEVGPCQRLKDADQPIDEYYGIAMKQITGRHHYPGVFDLGRDDDGLWLDGDNVNPANRRDAGREFVFRLPTK